MQIEVLAHDAWERGDLRTALRLFETGAKQGNSVCIFGLGYFYDEGLGTSANKGLARSWYKLAVRRGSSAAASNIAILFREQARYRRALKWFQKASRMGDGDADVEIAKLYLSGEGTRKSRPLANHYLQRAMTSNHITQAGREEAEEMLGRLRDAL